VCVVCFPFHSIALHSAPFCSVIPVLIYRGVCVCGKTQNTFQYLKKVIADVDVSYKIVIDILYKVLTLNTTNNVLLLNHILLHLKKLPPE